MPSVRRIVSLVPSVTETLLAWSVRPVGVTRFCEHPELTAVGGTKDPDVAAIIDLRPDLVVMDREENRLADADALAAAGVALHVLHVRSLADVPPALESLAGRIGVEAALPCLAGPERRRRLRAFVPIWRRPWMSINARTYGSSVLEAAGVTNVLGDDPATYPTVDLEAVAARRPDVVLAPSEPYPFSERQRPELEAVAPMVLIEGKDVFWWGVRSGGAVERLAAVLDQWRPAGI
jgi:ABC-type Fe3+-hydroxamate transport system substrate-binding protein